MKWEKPIKGLFIIAGVYNGLLGAGFLFASDPLLKWFDVTPPNHPGFVQFSAAMLIIFALMFLAISMNPVRNRNLIPYGILLKASYTGLFTFYWLTSGLPDIWKPFCITDFIFLMLFAWVLVEIWKTRLQKQGSDKSK